MGPARSRSRLDQRLVGASLAAALLPLLVFISLQAAFSAQSARREAEAGALEHARAIMTAVDARLERTRGAAAALATNSAIREGDWAAAYVRAKEIADLNPDWNRVILWDRVRGVEYFDTSRPFGTARTVPSFGLDPADLTDPSEIVFSGIRERGEGCPCLYAHAPAGRGSSRVLTVSLNSGIFQDLLAAKARPGSITSIVDRDGLIIARSRDFERRVGKPGSAYLRNAIRGGDSGIYRGVTLEGFENYSAFHKSPLSGWSVHFAFAPAVLDLPQAKSARATVMAAIAGLAVAAGLAWLMFKHIATERELIERRAEAQRAETVAQLKVARDLHDGVLQFLTGFVLRLEAMKRSSSSPEQARELGLLQSELRAEQRELRGFIERIAPRNAASPPPEGSLRALAESLSRRWGVAIEIRHANAEGMLSPSLRRNIDHIVREATSNAVRHGGASRIVVDLAVDDDRVEMTIRDDGRGFPVSGRFDNEALAASNQQPRSIYSRVREAGGTLVIETGNRGSCLAIRLPA